MKVETDEAFPHSENISVENDQNLWRTLTPLAQPNTPYYLSNEHFQHVAIISLIIRHPYLSKNFLKNYN